jgi:hypothetical protein
MNRHSSVCWLDNKDITIDSRDVRLWDIWQGRVELDNAVLHRVLSVMHSCVCRTTSFTSPTRRYRSVPPGRLGSGTGTQKLCFNGENIESWGSSSYSTVDILYLFLFMLVRGPGPRRQSPPSAWSYLIPWHSAINGNSHTKLEKMLFVRSY